MNVSINTRKSLVPGERLSAMCIERSLKRIDSCSVWALCLNAEDLRRKSMIEQESVR
jgi:hypothetical protein